MGNNDSTLIRVSTEYKDWLDTQIDKKGESYEDILRRLTGFKPREAAVGVAQN
jgi:hypothetical protein